MTKNVKKPMPGNIPNPPRKPLRRQSMQKKARVAIRSNSGGGKWIFPTRVYIYLAAVNAVEEPKRLGMQYYECTWRTVNSRATRRMRNVVSRAVNLAQAYNEGRIAWNEVESEY